MSGTKHDPSREGACFVRHKARSFTRTFVLCAWRRAAAWCCAARFAAAAASDGITMVTAIHEIVADGLCIFLASHVQRSGARAINISTTVAQWTAAATWYKRMCCQQRLFHLIFQRICSSATALISQVFTADAWKHSWLPALRMALPIGERCAAMWFHATDNMSVASNYIVLEPTAMDGKLFSTRYPVRAAHGAGRQLVAAGNIGFW